MAEARSHHAGGAGPIAPDAAWVLTFAATATMAVSYIDRQALSVLSPTITKALGMSESTYGWLGSAFAIAYLVCTPLAGRTIDLVGARRGLLASVLIWSGVAAAHALVPGITTLFLLRVLLGAAESPSFPGAAQTISRVLSPARRSFGFGVLFTGSSIGAMLAPPLATWLTARWGWRYAMLGTAISGLSWVPLWLYATRGAATRRVLDERPAAVAGPGFRWSVLVAAPGVLRAVLVVLSTAPTVAFVMHWGAKVLVSMHGLTQAQIGGYLWLPAAFFDLGAVGFGALAARREGRHSPDLQSPHRLLVAVAAVLATTIAVLGMTRTPWETTLLFALALAGGGGLYALVTADMMKRIDPSLIAASAGVTAAAQSVAQIFANPIIGRSMDRTRSYSGVAVALGLFVIPGAIAWIAWDPRRPRTHHSDDTRSS